MICYACQSSAFRYPICCAAPPILLYVTSLSSHLTRRPLSCTKLSVRVVYNVTSSDLRSSPSSVGTKRPKSSLSSPEPSSKSKIDRQEGISGLLSPASVQSPPELVRVVYANRTNAGQKCVDRRKTLLRNHISLPDTLPHALL